MKVTEDAEFWAGKANELQGKINEMEKTNRFVARVLSDSLARHARLWHLDEWMAKKLNSLADKLEGK